MKIKLTVLYGHPLEPEVFEDYYKNTHLPLVARMTGFERVEYTKFFSAETGPPSTHYRMAEFWFSGPEALQSTMNSPEGQATGADLANFATGGVSLLVGVIEE